MALTKNREILYKNPVEFIEHKTGKTVKSWQRDYASLRVIFIFTDNTCTYIDEGGLMSMNIVYEPLPKSICVSCGEQAHVSLWDWNGRCEKSLKNFWKKVRKVYWHRYTKNK